LFEIRLLSTFDPLSVHSTRAWPVRFDGSKHATLSANNPAAYVFPAMPGRGAPGRLVFTNLLPALDPVAPVMSGPRNNKINAIRHEGTKNKRFYQHFMQVLCDFVFSFERAAAIFAGMQEPKRHIFYPPVLITVKKIAAQNQPADNARRRH
jgi:hypothetical protein